MALKPVTDPAILAQLNAGAEGKPLPDGAAKRLEDSVGIYGNLKSSAAGFQDDYAGNTLTGGLENTIQGKLSGFGTEGQRNWWATFKSNDNVIRNELFGAALTPAERQSYEATTVEPDLDPKIVRENLKIRSEIIRKALARRTDFFKKNGYKPGAVDSLVGEYAPDFAADYKPRADQDEQNKAGSVTTGEIGFDAPTAPRSQPSEQDYADYQRLASDPNATAADAAKFFADRGFTLQNMAEMDKAQKAGAGLNNSGDIITVLPKIDRDISRPAPLATDRGGDGVVAQTVENADAAIRGLADITTFGMADEIAAAGDTIFNGGTMGENLRRQRGVDEYDSENNFWPRLTGSLLGGALLPTKVPGAFKDAALNAARSGVGREAALRTGAQAAGKRAALEGGVLGGGYGFGSTDGDIEDRALGGATGAIAGTTLGGLGGRYLSGAGVRRGPPSGGSGRRTLGDYLRVKEAADRQNITLLPADVGGPATRMATAASNMTLGGIPIAKASEVALGSARDARDNVSALAGNVLDRTSAGQAAQRGARQWLSESEQRGGKLYEDIPVENDRRALLSNTRTALGELTKGFESNPDLSRLWAENPRLKATLEALTTKTAPILNSAPEGAVSPALGSRTVGTALDGGALSWGDLKRFRTIIGEMVGQPGLAADGNQVASLRRLYGALSDDMQATASATGPQAEKAFGRANKYWRAREDRVNNVLSDILGSDFQKSPEAAMSQIERWASKTSGDSKSLGRALRSLPDEDANSVRATILSQLGNASAGAQNATGDVFSPASFMTQWNKLSDRAKSQLFGGEHKEAINDIVTVMDAMKGAEKYANTSKTALAGNGIALISTVMASPLAGAAFGGAQLAIGKILSSPKLVNYLTKAPKSGNPEAVSKWIEGLGRVARSEPSISGDVMNLQQRLSAAFNSSPATRAAAEEPDE